MLQKYKKKLIWQTFIQKNDFSFALHILTSTE